MFTVPQEATFRSMPEIFPEKRIHGGGDGTEVTE